MKYLSKITPCICAILFLIGQGGILTSCNDDLAADSYYTFTGEMMSDFLANREDFSQFKRIVERAGRMDLLASRGARTLFPPVNSGVEAFLKEKGYASVEDIPASFCDTLVKACLIERTLYTYNLSETHQESNQLDLPLIMVTNGDTVDANQMVLTVINRRAAIINELKNDSVENGVVHPVDKVLVPNTSLGASLLDENHEDFREQPCLIPCRVTAMTATKSGKTIMPLSRQACVSETRIMWANVPIIGIAVSRFSSYPTKYFTRNTATVSTRA